MNINQDTALMRGVRTFIASVGGVLVGLLTTVWAVPGVPEAVTTYLVNNAAALAASVGVPAAVISFVWNARRKDVENF